MPDEAAALARDGSPRMTMGEVWDAMRERLHIGTGRAAQGYAQVNTDESV
jgi:hypothetical protein